MSLTVVSRLAIKICPVCRHMIGPPLSIRQKQNRISNGCTRHTRHITQHGVKQHQTSRTQTHIYKRSRKHRRAVMALVAVAEVAVVVAVVAVVAG